MKNGFSFIKDGSRLLMMSIAVVAGVLFVTMAVNAATTISTNIATDGTLLVNNATSTISNLDMLNSTSTQATSTALFSTTIRGTNATLTNLTSTNSTSTNATTTSLYVSGIASSTTLKVGNDTVSLISGLIFGTCAVQAANVAAASSTYATCTGATGVTSAYKVFVQATSSIPIATVVTAASSTVTTGTLSIRFHADGGAVNLAANELYLNFWAVR